MFIYVHRIYFYKTQAGDKSKVKTNIKCYGVGYTGGMTQTISSVWRRDTPGNAMDINIEMFKRTGQSRTSSGDFR